MNNVSGVCWKCRGYMKQFVSIFVRGSIELLMDFTKNVSTMRMDLSVKRVFGCFLIDEMILWKQHRGQLVVMTFSI